MISNIAESTGSASIADQLKGSQLTQDGFMKLLLAQLRLQSPTSPFDSSTMMQQISQLTALSSTQALEKTVKGLSDSMGTSQILEASRLVGQHVQIPSETCPLVTGEGLKGAVVVPKGVDKIEVTVRDSHDNIVKTMSLNPLSDGVLDFSWNGMDAANNPLAAGYYKVSASTSLDGKNVALPVAGTFKVNSVAMDRNGKGVILNVDGLGGVSMQDIIKIM
ncbi:MAG: FlgD immunoglobulin-like domain containing protein [Legionellales bacterium]